LATVYDVAARAGVSHTTVSNVFRHPDRVTVAVRRRVMSAAKDLGYLGPNAAAAGLRTGRVGTIGVVLTSSLSYAFTDPAAVALLQGIAGELSSTGITVLPVTGATADAAVSTAPIDGLVAYSLPGDHAAVGARRHATSAG
jgi:DNA-binding LacI/PurR family transcriptional regulator